MPSQTVLRISSIIWFESFYQITVNDLTMKAEILIFLIPKTRILSSYLFVEAGILVFIFLKRIN